MTFEAEYTLNDIEAWIGCSDAHGEIIWTKSGLFNVLCNVFASEAAGKYGSVNRDQLYDEGAARVGDVFDRLKRNENQKYFGHFNDTTHFFRYFLKSMHCLHFNEQNRKKTELSLEEVDAAQPLYTEGFEDDWLYNHQQDVLLDKAEALIQDFAAWLDTTRASSVRKHLAGLLKAECRHKELFIAGFLETGSNADFFRRHFQRSGNFRENTYKSSNRRLRQLWQKYISTEQGRKLYQDFRGLVQP